MSQVISYHLPINFSYEYNVSMMRDLYESRDDKLRKYLGLRFSPDGKFLATGQTDDGVKVGFPN